MEEAQEVNLQENTIIVSSTNGAHMEEAWEASSKENIIISQGMEEGGLSTSVKGEEDMQEGMKNVPCMKRMEQRGKKCELVNHVGEIIVEKRIVTYDPREPILDDNPGETNVGVIIFNYLKDQSQIISIWRWSLSQTILDGHFFIIIVCYI